jgi:hypothetical protein
MVGCGIATIRKYIVEQVSFHFVLCLFCLLFSWFSRFRPAFRIIVIRHGMRLVREDCEVGLVLLSGSFGRVAILALCPLSGSATAGPVRPVGH